MNVNVLVADESHLPYAESVCHELYLSSLGDKIGIARRTPEYIRDKILAGKAVIALTDDGEFAGFSYIESWGGKSFVANSGLIVPEKFRSLGIAKRIKEQTFILSRKLFPNAKIFSMTTSSAVMKMNYEFGFRPVTYDDLTDDLEFWKGCEGCRNFPVLKEQNYRVCICTGLLYDPKEHLKIQHPKEKEKVVVAYSGGLDTSYAVSWLSNETDYEVHAVCADTGGFSPEQMKTNEVNAYKLGASKFTAIDITQEYYEKSLKYMIFGNVLRNGTYPISVSSERLFQAMAVARYAKETGASAIAHGSTGAGNDQVRFDMVFQVMCPGVKIITLTRDGNLSRQQEVDYLNAHGFPADFAKLKYSYNVGLWGTSICGGEILDSKQGLPESAYLKQVEKEGSEILSLDFKEGELVGVNGVSYDDKVAAVKAVEAVGAAWGIGRDMHVGDTIIGIKGRVGFEAAAPMLIIGAHRFLEKFTLSKWQQYWKDQVGTWYGMFLHESQYLEPVMRDIEAMLESSQRHVNGTVTLELRPRGFSTVGVDSPDDLLKSKLGEYGETQKGWSAEEAKGFIKLLSNPLRMYYGNHPEELPYEE